MEQFAKGQWVSTHIYCVDKRAQLLKEALPPLLALLTKEGKIDSFFFIRYADPKSHVRLRIKIAPEKTDWLKTAIGNYFESYFTQQAVSANGNIASPLYQLNFKTYEAEYARYGGEKAIRLAEQQFALSSQICLDHISGSSQWNYNLALGIALQMHLSLAFAFGLSREQTIRLFEGILAKWLPYNLHNPGLVFKSSDDLTQQKVKAIQSFEKALSEKTHWLTAIQKLWLAIQQAEAFDAEWMNQWLAEMKRIGEALKKMIAKGETSIAKIYLLDEVTPINSPAESQLFSLAASFIHMTNNRLGIFNQDETFLAFLIKESLCLNKTKNV